MAVPINITDHQRSRSLHIEWSDARRTDLSHQLLRASCRCARCEQQRRAGQPPRVDPAIMLVSIEPVGDHGLNLGFSDGHSRGIYPWHWLRELGLQAAPWPPATDAAA